MIKLIRTCTKCYCTFSMSEKAELCENCGGRLVTDYDSSGVDGSKKNG